MAATLTTSPASPASAYRPLEFVLTRTDPSLSRINFIRPATGTDVSTLGNGLVEGDILVQHQAWSGSIPGVVGQTINLIEDCEQYAGVWTILNAFTSGGNNYVVIDAPDSGVFDPSPSFGSGRIWLNGYTIWCELSVYTDPAAAPQVSYLYAVPDINGKVTFNVAPDVADYFNTEIHPYVLPWTGTVLQHAHGVSALYYRVRFVEVYDVPGVTTGVNPWEDGTEVHADESHRVAVNAVHPYHSELTTWETASMSTFVVGTSSKRFLTYAPRTLSVGDADSFRLFMLTGTSGIVNHNLIVKRVNSDGSLTTLTSQSLSLGATPYAAFAVAVGPADLAGLITVPERYRVWLTDSEDNVASETFEFIVDTTCKEVRRPIGWLGKLGGVDLFTFTGREIENVNASRATLRRPMSSTTGFDWSERSYASGPATGYTLSSSLLNGETRAWVARELMHTANAVLKLSSTQATTIILQGGAVTSANTGGIFRPITIEYRRGTDNIVQQA